MKIALVIVLGIVLFSTNYYLYSNRIIKVENFSLTVTGTPNFDGIENLTNLKELTLNDKVIGDYDKLLNIPTLEKINLYSPLNVNDELINAARAKGIEVNVREEANITFK